ncbi:hypothetical protein MRX96_002367 [Rhipicephalus microplus]
MRGSSWSDSTVQESLKVRFACGTKGYECLRDNRWPLLPERTLQKNIENIKFSPGHSTLASSDSSALAGLATCPGVHAWRSYVQVENDRSIPLFRFFELKTRLEDLRAELDDVKMPAMRENLEPEEQESLEYLAGYIALSVGKKYGRCDLFKGTGTGTDAARAG